MATRESEGALWGHLASAHLSARGLQYPGLEAAKHAWCLLRSSSGAVFWEQSFGVDGSLEEEKETSSQNAAGEEAFNLVATSLNANISSA